jgi:hypothetical protein
VDLDRVASRELVEQLWEDVRRREAVLAALPEVAAPELSFSVYLRYLNLHWRHEPLADPFAGSRSPKHRVARRLVKLIDHVLAPFFARDEDFRAHVVRVSNATAEAHDELLREVRLLRVAIEERTMRMSERNDSLARQMDARLTALERRTPASERPA